MLSPNAWKNRSTLYACLAAIPHVYALTYTKTKPYSRQSEYEEEQCQNSFWIR